MKRTFTFLMTLFLSIGAMWAQVTSLEGFSQDKCYTFATVDRGAWAVDAEGTLFSSTGDQGLAVDASDPRQQFAVLSANNGADYYLYSVSAKKLVKANCSLVAGPADALAIADASSQGEGRVQFRFRDVANSYINLGGSKQMSVDWWGTIDAGNAVLVTEAGDFNAAEAWAQLLAENKAQAQELVEANATNHAAAPALGQYATADYEAFVAAVENAASMEEVAAAIAAFEASKNCPLFTIDSQKDYALGQSIYENEEGALKFKTTDVADKSMLWAFDMNATEVGLTDKVVVRNAATGNLFWGASFISVIETEPAVEGDGVFMFKTEGTGAPVHAQQSGSSIVRWSSADANAVGGASTWKFTFVGISNPAAYDLSEVAASFKEQAMAFAGLQDEAALSALPAVQEKWAEGMGVVEPLFGAVEEGNLVLKADVEAAMEMMSSIQAVVAFYAADFSECLADAEEFLATLEKGSERYQAWDAAIAEAKVVNNVTTVKELEDKMAALEEAFANLPEDKDPNDYTSYIINADLSTGEAWNTEGTKGISGGMVKVASESAFDFSQTITLPAGQYKMTAKAVYRYAGSEAEEFAAIEAGTKTRLVNLYAETATCKYEADVMNRYDGASDTDYAAGNGSVTVNGKFVPNSSSAVQAWFNNGQYVNELVFNVQEEGQVKIGLTRTGSIAGDYTNIGAWTLTRLGDAEADPNDYTSHIINADLSTGDAWNTVGTKGIADGMVKVASESAFDFSQTITLPTGQYKMTAKAAYRYTGSEAEEFAAIEAGTKTRLVNLYAETATYKYEADVMNRYDGASDTDYAAGNGSVTVNGKFVPNSSSAVQAWFNNGQYVNELVFNVQEEGQVKIGLTRTGSISGDYTNIGAWTLTRLGDAEADPEVEEPTPDPDPTPDPEKPEIGDVTSKYLVNADFETASAQNGNAINTPPGWTLKHETSGWLDGSTRASTNPGGDGSQCYNLWAGTVNLADIYQTVALPAGKYKLTVGLYSDGDAERYAYVTVGGNTIKSARPQFGSWDFVSVEFSNPTEGEVTMGAVSKGWFQIDNVTLEYTGEVGKDDFVNAYNQALSEAQALVGQKMSVAAAAQLEATIAAYGSLTAENSTDELEAATDAILAELVSVKASVNSYKVLAVGALPDNSLEGWTCTNSNTFHINTWSGEGNSDGTNMVTPFIENWVGKESLLGNGKISYTLPGVDPGYYKVSSLIRVYSEANNDIAGASFFANEVKTDFATGKPFTYNNMKGIYDVYTAVVNVGEEGVLEFGVEIENPTFNWVAFKNVKIEYIGVIDQAAAEALKAKIPTSKYDAALTAEIEALVAAIDAGVTYENYLALSEKVALAETSAAAYAANKIAIDGMFTLLANTNVYTAEAYSVYKAKAEDFLTQYDAGTLNAPVDNPVAIHGWHASVDYDDLLLSAFGVKDFDDALHINTWSTEGEADGSEFKVPFYEYWTGDGESLGVATKTATVTGLTPGMYYAVEAWVRVRAKNGVAATDATGITLSVSNGEAVDLTEGEVVGTSQFSHAVYTAYGYADAEGNLTINFNVLEGNNVSWLSFKNLKYAEAKVDVAEVALNETAIEFEELGVTFQLEATVTPVDATSPAVTWTSSDDAVATVDENGLVTAVAVGTATITATADGVSATCAVTVTNIYDLSEVKDAFVAQAQEFMALAEGNMALYKLTALQTKCSEVMTLVNTLYEQIAGEEKVLKSSVVAAMEAMTTTKAEVEPVVAYYNEAYNTAWWDADDVLQSLDTDSEDYATLDAAIVAASDLSAVTTVAELEEKVAAINAAVAALYNLDETIEGEWEDVTNKPNEYGWTIIDHAELLGLGDYWVATNNTRYDEERGVMEFVAGENAAASLIQEWCPFGQATYRLTGKAFHNGAVNAVMFVGDQTVEIPAAAEGATFENAEEYFTTFSIEFTCESAWGTQLNVGYSCEFDNAEDFLVVGGLKLEEKKSTTIKSIFMETIMALESLGYEIMAMEALHADQQEVMAVAMPIYEAIMGDQKVLKSEVEQSIEDMQAIMAELNPVAAYYKGEFMDVLYAAEDFKWTLDEASQAYTDLEAAINEAADVAAVTTVAELEAKVAALEELMRLIETGIDNIETETETVIYDLSGRRVTEMTKGIYIVNGKKVLVK